MIGGIQTCSFNDFPGHLSVVVFTRGCNLRCRYCHNPQLVHPEGEAPRQNRSEVDDLLRRRAGQLTGMVVTGGEPCLYAGLPDLLRLAKRRGFATKLDTNGTLPHIVVDVVRPGLVDYVAVDVKVAPGTSSQWLCGFAGQAEAALDTLTFVASRGLPCEARTTLVRGTHDVSTLRRIALALAASGIRRWRMQPVRSGRVLDPNAQLQPPSDEEVGAALAGARDLGLDATCRHRLEATDPAWKPARRESSDKEAHVTAP